MDSLGEHVRLQNEELKALALVDAPVGELGQRRPRQRLIFDQGGDPIRVVGRDGQSRVEEILFGTQDKQRAAAMVGQKGRRIDARDLVPEPCTQILAGHAR